MYSFEHPKEIAVDEVQSYTIDWRRSVIIDNTIDDEMVKRLTPQILSLRQENNDPITVGINSLGGSTASLDILLGLLTGPNQDGVTGEIITVATHRAYSAAANFLAFGDYSVALPHSQVLFHDVRFGGMVDVTPEKARDAAKSLQEANDTFALRLASVIIKRLIWIYIDLRPEFEKYTNKYSGIYQRYSTIVSAYAPKVEGYEGPDIASFATTLWSRVSSKNDSLIDNVMERLDRWISLSSIAKSAKTYRSKGSRTPGMLDGLRHLHKLFSGKADQFEAAEEDLKLLLSLIISSISSKKSGRINFPLVLEDSVREFGVLNSMNATRHIRYASDLMLRHSHIFFANELNGELDAMPEEEKTLLFAKASPHARILWHFCVLLCRELFEGEHTLNPNDAQLLGLIDEVSGGGPIQSKRDYRVELAKSAAAAAQPADSTPTGEPQKIQDPSPSEALAFTP